MRRLGGRAVVVLIFSLSGTAAAQPAPDPLTASATPPSESSTAVPATTSEYTPHDGEAPGKPAVSKPPPYSIPFQLRPVVTATVIRSDNSIAAYENKQGVGGLTIVNGLTGAYKFSPNFGALVRLTTSQDSPPVGNGGFIFANPVVGGQYALKAGDFRFAAYLLLTVPVGGGGGDAPSPGAADARAAGPFARMAMENAIFAVNDFTVFPGIDFAYVAHGLTVQAEATFFQLQRVRGEAKQREASKTNLTAGLHIGYFLAPFVSVGADLRYQRWLNPPFGGPKQGDITASDPRIDSLSFGVGPRFHFLLGKSIWLRPGIAYSRGLDKPLAASTPNYHVVQIDVPVLF